MMKSKISWLFYTIFSIAILCLTFLFFIEIELSPLSDDLSMIAFSKSISSHWFTKGLANYFIVYPEFYGAQSNFIRPVSNFLYWLFGKLIISDSPFLSNTVQLVALTYGTLLGISWMVSRLIFDFNKSHSLAVFGFFSCILIPTFWTTPTPTYTSFAFDGLSILFCLGALFAFEKRRILLMALLMTFALMTKEISVPVILGFLITFALSRNIGAILACSFSIFIFLFVRLIGFGFHADGVYVFDDSRIFTLTFVVEKLRNVFTMPFGPVFYNDIFTGSGLSFANRSGVLLLINSVLLSGIALFLISKSWPLIKNVNQHFIGNLRKIFSQNEIQRLAAGAAVTSFFFDAYVGANYRYVFNFLPFLFIATAGIQVSMIRKHVIFGVFLIGSLVASAPYIFRLNDGFELEKFRYQTVRQLFEILRIQDNSRTLIIVNDFVLGYANSSSLNVLVPTERNIQRGTSIYLESCSLQSIAKIETSVSTSPDEMRLSVKLPSCARFVFESSPNLHKFASGNKILRNDTITYEFLPEDGERYANITGWSGRDLTITVRAADIVYYDFQTSQWIYLEHQAR